nr:glycerophosphodiester phosphodiesterase GDPD1, chloroplastic-like [Tanacetum cinerariifolium]
LLKIKDCKVDDVDRDYKNHEAGVGNCYQCCTKREKINHSKRFNLEFKFDYNVEFAEDKMVYSIQVVFQVVSEYAKERPIFSSIFQRNATFLVWKLQKAYHVCLVSEIREGFGSKIRVVTGAFGVELRAGMGGFGC